MVRTNALVCCALAILLIVSSHLAAQESLAAARELYAAAEYEKALTMLDTLLAAKPSRQERQAIDLYRILCLFALNNVDEANRALEAMILRDPLFRPSMDDVPRRLRGTFTDTRKRLLPTIIREKYIVAKNAFDRGEYKDASTGFTQVLAALADPDVANEVEKGSLADLRVLATGFSELADKAMSPAPAPAPEAVAAPPTPTAAAIPSAAPRQPRIYQVGDAGVTLPVVIRQEMPAYSVKVAAQRSGQVDVVIDETGAVESATIVTSVDPRYNALVLAASKSWRYRPATVDGVPVKFRKRIQITVAPDQ